MSKQSKENNVSRRSFIRSVTTTATIGSVVAGSSLVPANSANGQERQGGGRAGRSPRAADAAEIRREAALRHLNYSNYLFPQRVNGDENRYASENYYASFTKTMPHNELGEVDPAAFDALTAACESGDPILFDEIPLDESADRVLANPQGALRYVFAGLDGHATRMRPSPTFRSAETAAEMGEVYWLALTRDIPFTDYPSNSRIDGAIDDLNQFSETVGPLDNGLVTPDVLFRGSTQGDLVGPYVSQFLWKDVPYGPSTIVQRYARPVTGDDFMTSTANWLNVQKGGAPLESQSFANDVRFIYNNRTLGEYVHRDVLFQAYFNAMLIALGYGPNALSVGNPYGVSITNQGGFTTLGGPWFIDLLTQAGNLALNGAWCHKWLHHRRLRPEVFAGRVHHHVEGNAEYELHADILESAALSEVFGHNGTYLLPMAYPEGSPTHPSYPAGHATVSGACATILKAVFDEGFVIPDPVVTENGVQLSAYTGPELTLGGEFNKLASNVALGRDAAGVHYRSDGKDGLAVGEQQAIALLQDYSTAINEEFGGFHFTKFDGTPISINRGKVS